MRAKLAVLTVALLALTGCGISTGNQPDPDADDITGNWQLVAGTDLTGTFVLDDVPQPITLELSGSTAAGRAPCNTYTGEFNGTSDGVDLGPFATTRMACSPDSVMELESRYIAGLEAADTATVDGSTLTLTLNDDVLELVFEEAAATPAADLVGPTWTLETIAVGETSAPVAGEATLIFGEDGTFRGNAGCRGFSGTYEIDDTDAARPTVDVSDLVFDAADCPAEFVDQENQVELVLDDFFAEVQGDRMTLTADFQEMGLVYRVAGTEVLPPAVLPTTGVPCEGLGVDGGSGSEAGNGTTGSAGDPDVLCTN